MLRKFRAWCFHFVRGLVGITGLSVWQRSSGLCIWLESSSRGTQTYGKASLFLWACSNPNVAARLDLISCITPASESRQTNQTTASLQRKQTGPLPLNGKYTGFLGWASTKIIQGKYDGFERILIILSSDLQFFLDFWQVLMERCKRLNSRLKSFCGFSPAEPLWILKGGRMHRVHSTSLYFLNFP